MSYIGNQPLYTSYVTDRFSGNGATLAYTLSIAPANSASLLVAIYGVLQDPNAYGVVGNTLTFTSAPPAGTNNISVRYLGLPASNVVTSSYRTVTDIIATAGQTTFSPASYTPGFIDVYRNGSKLATADFTATNGAQVVLVNAAAAGDIIQTVGFSVGSVLNAIPAVAGSVNSGYLDVANRDGTGAMQLPAGTTAQRPASPQVGMQRWNTTLQAMEIFVGSNVWQLVASSSYAVEYLVVAGGGGGGYQVGGGGGAGGLLTSTFNTSPAASYTITVGAAGAGAPNSGVQGSNGADSSIVGVATATGGGRGSNHNAPTSVPGNGGSGGGGSGNSNSQNVPGGSGTAGQGFGGGTGLASSWAGGGGGGATAVGANATANTGGPGGAGRNLTQFSIVGGSPAGSFAGGGGGCSSGGAGTPRVLGGTGGGGDGYADNGGQYTGGTTGGDAVINTGGGGGGIRDQYVSGGAYTRAGNGASGIVALRYSGTPRGTGGTIIQSGGSTYHVFTSSGIFTA